jgi:hypothetical protein
MFHDTCGLGTSENEFQVNINESSLKIPLSVLQWHLHPNTAIQSISTVDLSNSHDSLQGI